MRMLAWGVETSEAKLLICLFYKDFTKWCPCIFHFPYIDQYVEGLLPFLLSVCFLLDKMQFRILCLPYLCIISDLRHLLL